MWQYSDEEFYLNSQIQSDIVLMAEDINLIIPIREEKYFLYLVRKSDLYSVYQELKEAKRVKKWKVRNSRHGLKWVIHKLNQKRPPSNKIGQEI